MASTSDPHQGDPLTLSFAKRVVELRTALGIDTTELGRRAGMSQALIWRLETGRAQPNLRTLARLAVALATPLPQLLENVEYEEVELRSRSYARRTTSRNDDHG